MGDADDDTEGDGDDTDARPHAPAAKQSMDANSRRIRPRYDGSEARAIGHKLDTPRRAGASMAWSDCSAPKGGW